MRESATRMSPLGATVTAEMSLNWPRPFPREPMVFNSLPLVSKTRTEPMPLSAMTTLSSRSKAMSMGSLKSSWVKDPGTKFQVKNSTNRTFSTSLVVDNFDLLRKIVEKSLGEKLVKLLRTFFVVDNFDFTRKIVKKTREITWGFGYAIFSL